MIVRETGIRTPFEVMCVFEVGGSARPEENTHQFGKRFEPVRYSYMKVDAQQGMNVGQHSLVEGSLDTGPVHEPHGFKKCIRVLGDVLALPAMGRDVV